MTTINEYELKVRRVKVDGLVRGRLVKYPIDVVNAARYLIGGAAEEHFIVFALNVKNEVVGHYTVAVGGIDLCPVDMRAIFRLALVTSASGIIAIHNHPSGSPEPSEQDVLVTEKMVKAAKLLDLPLIDHIVVAGEDHYSFREHRPDMFK